jgi:hypothetical protein
MMEKDLIMISSFCNTKEKEDTLRNLVLQISNHKDKFDLMIVSHTVVPDDISDKCDFVFFDKKNELLYDWNLRCTPWFDPDNQRPIMSIFTGFFNTHLAIWRMLILGNSIAKNAGYNKVHHIEYDSSILNFSELYDNSNLLNTHDCVTYTKSKDTVDDILFGTYQSYRLDTLSEQLLVLDEENLKTKIRDSISKSPEEMLYEVLHSGKKGVIKKKDLLDKDGNQFGLTTNKLSNNHTAWCLPYYDRLTKKLSFVVWNSEEDRGPINIQLIYNDDRVINFNNIKHLHWVVNDIDDFDNAKKLIVILNGKIRDEYNFIVDGEKFKQASFREIKSR